MDGLRLAPQDQVAIAVGNQLRIANQRFDDAIRAYRPWTLIDYILADLEAL